MQDVFFIIKVHEYRASIYAEMSSQFIRTLIKKVL